MANTFSHQILLKVLDMLNAIQKILHEKKTQTTLSQLISLDTSMPQGRRPEGRYWSMVDFGVVFVFDMYDVIV